MVYFWYKDTCELEANERWGRPDNAVRAAQLYPLFVGLHFSSCFFSKRTEAKTVQNTMLMINDVFLQSVFQVSEWFSLEEKIIYCFLKQRRGYPKTIQRLKKMIQSIPI